MKRGIVSASAFLLAVGLAASPEAVAQLPFGLSASDVEAGFIMAVMDGCANAAETGRTLDQLNPYRIIRDTNRGAARAPKPGYTAWAPGMGVGIVEINDGPGGCDVVAFGASVVSTFHAVSGALIARGYVAEPAGASEVGSVRHDLVRRVGGRTVRVVLAGSEAGSASQFSQLSASVTITSS